MIWGYRIRELREKRGLTQSALGELIGADGNLISRWERNKVTPSNTYLDKLATVFDVPIDSLMRKNETSLPSIQEGVPPCSSQVGGPARLVYQSADGERLELPATAEGYALFEKLVVAMMAGSVRDEACASPRSAGAAKPA